MQLKGVSCSKRGVRAIKRSPVRAIKRSPAPVTGPSVPLAGLSFTLTGTLFNCRIVGHSPGFKLHRTAGCLYRSWPDLKERYLLRSWSWLLLRCLLLRDLSRAQPAPRRARRRGNRDSFHDLGGCGGYATYGHDSYPPKLRRNQEDCGVSEEKIPEPFLEHFFRKREGVQKSMGRKVPWKTGMLSYLPVTSRPLVSLQKEAVLSPFTLQPPI